MRTKSMQTTAATFLALLIIFGATPIFVSGQEGEGTGFPEKFKRSDTASKASGKPPSRSEIVRQAALSELSEVFQLITRAAPSAKHQTV